MADIEITVEGGKQKKLLTAGKYCDKNILVTATGAPVNPTAEPKDINFYDYDGSLVYAYTLEEAHALSNLPVGPEHNGLVFDGWNWSLEDVKAQTYSVNVGAMYMTASGATELIIELIDLTRNTVELYISQTEDAGVVIDWGDGSEKETIPGTGFVTTSHVYAETGSFVISLDPSETCVLGFGKGTSTYCVFGVSESDNFVSARILKGVRIGRNVPEIGNYSFVYCRALEYITVPSSLTSFGKGAMHYCSAMKCLIIPSGDPEVLSNQYMIGLSIMCLPNSPGVLSGSNVFRYANALISVSIPPKCTLINSNCFYNIYGVSSLFIPESVATLGSGCFGNCTSMKEYHLLAQTPPKLSNSNVFVHIPSDCIIYVPRGSLEAYQTATNWATYANYMQEEPE